MHLRCKKALQLLFQKVHITVLGLLIHLYRAFRSQISDHTTSRPRHRCKIRPLVLLPFVYFAVYYSLWTLHIPVLYMIDLTLFGYFILPSVSTTELPHYHVLILHQHKHTLFYGGFYVVIEPDDRISILVYTNFVHRYCTVPM